MSFVAFAIVALAPGDPVMMELRAMGIVPKPEDIEALRARFGLDKPLLQRYFEWLARAIRFDFGSSVATGRTVISEIGIHLPATLTLAISSLIGAVLISLGLGAFAVTSGRVVGAGLRGLTILLVSVPSFWLALLLIHIFILQLGWGRLVGEGTWYDLVLPTLTLSLGAGASLGRFVFERVRAEKSEDYVRLATAWANTFGALLGGAVIVESIFGWPGLGQLILQAIAQRDFPVIQAYLVFMGLIFFATSLFADIIVVISDPQLRRRLDRE